MNRLNSPLAFGLLAVLLIGFAQLKAGANLFTAWQTEEYSHGFLIPFVAALLAWHRLVEKKPVLRPSWLAIPFLLAGGGLQLVSRLSSFMAAEQYGLILDLAGLSLAFLGRSATFSITPALVYLAFAVPLPHLTQASLAEDMQLLSSTLGVAVLDSAGVSVFQEGNVIDLGGYRLQVVEACSGLRYLFPLASFGYLVAFLLKDAWWKRAVVLLSTIPIAIGMNALRIALIGMAVDRWGIGMAEGMIHALEGWTVFLACTALLLLETWALQRIGARGHFRLDYLTPPRGALTGGRVARRGPWLAALIIAALLAGLFGTGVVDERAEQTPPHAPLAGFPLMLGDWQGKQAAIPPDILEALQLSDHWIADYRRPSDDMPVNLYIAYYASQRVGATTHSPSNCIPGGGWRIETSEVRRADQQGGAALKFTRLLVRRGEERQLVYYWFDERGRNLTETTEAKWYMLWDAMFMRRTDGALIRLVTPLTRHEEEAAADLRLKGFLTMLQPHIRAFIPGGATANTIAAP